MGAICPQGMREPFANHHEKTVLSTISIAFPAIGELGARDSAESNVVHDLLSLYVGVDDRLTRDDLAHLCVATSSSKLLDPAKPVLYQVHHMSDLQIHRRMQTVMCHDGLQAMAACSEAEQWYFDAQGWVSSRLYREGGNNGCKDGKKGDAAAAADAADAASDADHAGDAAAPRTPLWPSGVLRTPLLESLPSASTKQEQPSLAQPDKNRSKDKFWRPVFCPEHVVKFLKRNFASCVNMLFWHDYESLDRTWFPRVMRNTVPWALVWHDYSTVTEMLGPSPQQKKRFCCGPTADGVGSEAHSEARYRAAMVKAKQPNGDPSSSSQ